MADLTLDQLQVGKPVKIEKNGKTICIAPSTIRALTPKHLYQRVK